jgi:hypothetical protein
MDLSYMELLKTGEADPVPVLILITISDQPRLFHMYNTMMYHPRTKSSRDHSWCISLELFQLI